MRNAFSPEKASSIFDFPLSIFSSSHVMVGSLGEGRGTGSSSFIMPYFCIVSTPAMAVRSETPMSGMPAREMTRSALRISPLSKTRSKRSTIVALPVRVGSKITQNYKGARDR